MKAMDVQPSCKFDDMAERVKEYRQLLADKSYMNVQFNPATGGLQATHMLHVFHPKRGHFEHEVANALFENGDKIILGKELAAPDEEVIPGSKHPDGIYNNESCEIASITGTGKNVVKRALKHCASKGADVAIIHFPDAAIYDETHFQNGIAMFNGTSKYRFKEIVVVKAGSVHKKSHP